MDVLLAAGTLAAAVALVYVCCIRPMRRGHCTPNTDTTQGGSELRAQQLAALREEVAGLHDEISSARAGQPADGN